MDDGRLGLRAEGKLTHTHHAGAVRVQPRAHPYVPHTCDNPQPTHIPLAHSLLKPHPPYGSGAVRSPEPTHTSLTPVTIPKPTHNLLTHTLR